MALHRIMKPIENMTGTVVESNFDTASYKPQQPLKSFVKLCSNTRNEIGRQLADFNVLINNDVEIIVENCLTK